MRLALVLAAKGAGRTSPNPLVGAVVVRGGTVVGQGYHRRAGGPHAEIRALRQAGERARGATLYLNLEPCAHFGRTPPCTDSILRAGIGRVVAGMTDPNPLVSGRGIRKLRRRGVRAEVGLLERECRELNAPFCKYITTGWPFVILKAALSLDGKIATRAGDSRWISCPASRKFVHRLRQRMDAVMVGVGTVLRDNPLLTVRLAGKGPRHPLRIIVDSRLRLPWGAQVVQTAGKVPTLVAATRAAPSSKLRRLAGIGIEVLVVRSDGRGQVSLRALMEELARRGIVSLLLEGGAALNASALREGIVDRLLCFYAPKLIGGETAPGLVGGEGIRRMAEAKAATIRQVKRLGPDLLVEWALGGK
ncbi:MAG: bifunctional diaminohydroxyphosphoribosylaminopyrimidine deaminase/5-amino-6-(5-phosphoribosylamino)uracil reductase RibD [Deltaproteobacteria bacterium]|nr:bifunctional diaminohydroxyphosphoribosylaminopyrimidine deaminase/5-amino-6-(5-phosphoribosylamino)uracil reductase RibD [Deltaproteobacteria bacterium]